jgi:hypothetical protein
MLPPLVACDVRGRKKKPLLLGKAERLRTMRGCDTRKGGGITSNHYGAELYREITGARVWRLLGVDGELTARRHACSSWLDVKGSCAQLRLVQACCSAQARNAPRHRCSGWFPWRLLAEPRDTFLPENSPIFLGLPRLLHRVGNRKRSAYVGRYRSPAGRDRYHFSWYFCTCQAPCFRAGRAGICMSFNLRKETIQQ